MALLDKLLRARRYYHMAKRPPTGRGLAAMVLTAVATKLINKALARKR